MKEQTYGPDEKIFSQGDLDYKFFFVMSGKVELEVSLNGSFSQQRILGQLKKGQQYGIHSLFSSEARKLTAKCLENTSILIIHKEDFIQILKEFRDDYEIYCMIKDKVSNNYEECDINCSSCQYKDHEITQCQLLQYKPRRELIINKVNYYQEQLYRDSSFVRRGLRSNFTLKHNQYIRQQLKNLRINILNKQFNNVVIKLQRKNEHLIEAIQDIGYDHDELFFNLVPEFFFYHNEIVMALDEEDFNKSSVYGSLYNQNQNLSIFNDQNIHFSKNYDVILDDQQFIDFETQQSNQANRNNKDFCNVLSNQKSLQLSGINEENLSENNYVKNQNSLGESNCSIGIHGTNIQNQVINSTSNHFIQNQTPILKHISQNYTNQMQVNLAQNSQKQNLYNLQSSNPYIPTSQFQIPEAPASPLLSYKNNNQTGIHQQQHAQQNQISISNHQQPVLLTQTSIKPLPIHNLQRESSLNKMLPYSPNNYQQSNRTIQVPSQSVADGTPQNQKNHIQNVNNFDNYSKIQLQKIQTENIQQENSFSMSPTKMKPIQSFDIIPNQSDSSHFQQQPQIQLQPDDQIKISFAQKEKRMQQNRKIKLKETQKPEKMVISNNRNIDQINEYKDQYVQEDEMFHRRSKRKITAYKDFQNDDEQIQRKSRRKITVFKDNLRLSIKEKKSEFLKESTQSIAQHLPFSESNAENNFIEEQILEKDIFVVMEFDIIHEFQHYFPQHNYSCIKFKNKQENIPDQIQSILQHTTNIVLKKNIKQIS
ncbi:cation channel family protein (macronuclear) [Tetrahymena thermophila SB210]|uniref:Cation channel family protein n=1 Tax=Tetrahymena thermophila (strain SB210) TaxID=312017 RepID=Q24DE6_TETTS|nr:cation channel family protein [Tetrahymena thermophila SB210]EAS05795.2 cation channel family protein [Tetrahymena thermophila SB210]|eukprot:XP_001026040.2 cation channel family protein [Tetrahymena thermophila SB210]